MSNLSFFFITDIFDDKRSMILRQTITLNKQISKTDYKLTNRKGLSQLDNWRGICSCIRVLLSSFLLKSIVFMVCEHDI